MWGNKIEEYLHYIRAHDICLELGNSSHQKIKNDFEYFVFTEKKIYLESIPSEIIFKSIPLIRRKHESTLKFLEESLEEYKQKISN
jgi:hypothetical protein